MTTTRGSTTVYTILTIGTGDVWRGGFLKRILSMLLNFDTGYVFLGLCTPSDIKSNGYKFVDDRKAISMYNALKRKLKCSFV